jgi:hypothetical protein
MFSRALIFLALVFIAMTCVITAQQQKNRSGDEFKIALPVGKPGHYPQP